ncbi:MAG TPA: hypothetical protein VGP24_18300 [Glaciihabitans sp.]|nr:hypothetical protein [Glaciihabitans sp.]
MTVCQLALGIVVTRASPIRKRAGAVSALVVCTALLLMGCSSSAAPKKQSVEVSYRDNGTAVTVPVDIDELTCSELAGTLLYSATGPSDADQWGLFTAAVTEQRDTHSMSIDLGDGLWFISTDPYSGDPGGVTFDGLDGIVRPIAFEDRMPNYGKSVDTAATATGTLECTTTR